jgi:carbonic anhydrase
MKLLPQLFQNNRQWANSKTAGDPQFFSRLSESQRPGYLWIGCADSRVPANEVVGLQAGELFVHRNVANLVDHSDLNVLSVVQYAIEVLHVPHVIICGHYQCGGIIAAMGRQSFGLVDNWLMPIRETYQLHRAELESLASAQERVDRLCELNVRRQVENLAHTALAQRAWAKSQPLSIHGWIYNLNDGLLRDMNCTLDSLNQVDPLHHYLV